MKVNPDDENEVQSARAHADPGMNRVTPVVRLEPDVALAVVSALAGIVREAHATAARLRTTAYDLQRAQRFEEGDVYMLEAPFEGFFADRYLMDFFDVRERGICSRMHLHTGLRFVRMMTGPATNIRVSSFSEIVVTSGIGWKGPELANFTDEIRIEGDDGTRLRHNVVVPENSWVDMQIPRGVSHQFNADGPHAVIDSVHPEESIETLREQMTGYRMMAQTLFLAAERPSGDECLDGR